ncbi:MAG: hypothetical protein J6X58_08060 [Bacteroidales bacterium]|nr:hypothetical protein [Bacteroidales bacterium]
MGTQLTNKVTDSPQFKSFMKTLALIGVAGTVVGVVLKLLVVHTGDSLLITGMGTLALVAFFLGSIFPCPYLCGMAIWKFAMTLTGYASAAAIVGLLFMIMHWSGGNSLLIVGLGTLVVCAIAWLWYLRYYKKHSDDQIFEEE